MSQPYGYAPTYKPSDPMVVPGAPSQNQQQQYSQLSNQYMPGMGVQPITGSFDRGEDNPDRTIGKENISTYVNENLNRTVLPGLPQAQDFVSDPYRAKFNYGTGEFEKWKTPTATLQGYGRQAGTTNGLPIRLQGNSIQNAYHNNVRYFNAGQYQNPLAALNGDFWGGSFGPINSMTDLVSRIEGMNAQNLNSMDFGATRAAFEAAAKNLYGAYANKDYQYRAGSSLDEQKNWLQNAYNLLVQRGMGENIF